MGIQQKFENAILQSGFPQSGDLIIDNMDKTSKACTILHLKEMLNEIKSIHETSEHFKDITCHTIITEIEQQLKELTTKTDWEQYKDEQTNKKE